MKKVFFIIAIASLAFVACNRAPKTADMKLQYTDTVGLAEFQAWKAALAQEQLANSYATVPARQTTRTRYANNSGTMTSTSTNQAKVVKKKGWSKAAKGAVIGGVSGGVLGAVINKRNRVAGGAIGAVLGAGAGYGIGRSMDKKDGRN